MTLAEFILIFAAILLVSSIGFKKYVWFISIGYGFSITATGITLLLLYGKTLDVFGILAAIVLILYGIRLSGYLAYRELKSKTYNKNMKGEIKDGKKMKLPIKCMLWVTCGLLYFMMCAPIIYRMANFAKTDTTFILPPGKNAFATPKDTENNTSPTASSSATTGSNTPVTGPFALY